MKKVITFFLTLVALFMYNESNSCANFTTCECSAFFRTQYGIRFGIGVSFGTCNGDCCSPTAGAAVVGYGTSAGVALMYVPSDDAGDFYAAFCGGGNCTQHTRILAK